MRRVLPVSEATRKSKNMTTPTTSLFGHFPLTLTLSLREREQFSNNSLCSNDTLYADRVATILPLPGGVGGGVGEHTTN
jgi:hypothetical protein